MPLCRRLNDVAFGVMLVTFAAGAWALLTGATAGTP